MNINKKASQKIIIHGGKRGRWREGTNDNIIGGADGLVGWASWAA